MQVLHVEDAAGSRVMFVWDGTDALPQPIMCAAPVLVCNAAMPAALSLVCKLKSYLPRAGCRTAAVRTLDSGTAWALMRTSARCAGAGCPCRCAHPHAADFCAL